MNSEFVAETPRLHLRQFVAGDEEFVVGLLGDPVTMKHWTAPLDAGQAAAWLQRAIESYADHGFGRWLVVLKDGGVPVGDVGIQRLVVNGSLENDLGYIIHHDHWGQGLGFEAALACIDWARARGLGSVVASMAQDNPASVHLARKLGMELEREFSNPRNANKATHLYRLELAGHS